MGCGCGKRRPSRANRIKTQRLTTFKSKRHSLQASKSTKTITAFSSRSSTCMSCVHSKQAPNERKKGIRVCHKSNRLINNIIRDKRFICPIGKWTK